MKLLFLLVLIFSPVNAHAANALVVCETSSPGWSFGFYGVQKTLQYLVVHAPLHKDYVFYPKHSDSIFKSDRYDFDGTKLVIIPDSEDFPQGLVLLSTGCDA